MARIAGIDLPRDKRVECGLTYIYGIGFSTSRKILAMFYLSSTRARQSNSRGRCPMRWKPSYRSIGRTREIHP